MLVKAIIQAQQNGYPPPDESVIARASELIDALSSRHRWSARSTNIGAGPNGTIEFVIVLDDGSDLTVFIESGTAGFGVVTPRVGGGFHEHDLAGARDVVRMIQSRAA
jgi:hypothetical protein